MWILDHFVESNRGYKENVFGKDKKRKSSGTYDLGEGENMLVKINNLQKNYNNKVFALNGATAHLKKG